MGYLGEETGKLGFGLMRLPMVGEDVDIQQTKTMVDLFMEKGFTYFDTAYIYSDGKSEEALKEAVVNRYDRDTFTIATKLPAWYGAKSEEDTQQMFYTSLKRTGATFFDYYLLHNLGGQRTESFEKYKVWDFARQQRDKGLIKHLGFSMHDKADVLDELLTKYGSDVEFVQLQINYADWNSNLIESKKCYEVALKHNKPIVIMEPVKGGSLANPPQTVLDILKEGNPNVSPTSWAIRFAASLKNVITVLSGMSNVQQMQDNLSFMEHFKPLSDSEQKVIEKVQEALKGIKNVPCTCCNYCVKGCPAGVVIPTIFDAYNRLLVYDDLNAAKGDYFWGTQDGGKASACIACGSCEQVCPQSLPIIETLREAHGILG